MNLSRSPLSETPLGHEDRGPPVKGAPTRAEIERIESRHAFWRAIGLVAMALGIPLLVYGLVLSDTKKEILCGGLMTALGGWRYWIFRKVRVGPNP